MKNENYSLITGASKGIGKAMALECAKRGLNVLLVSLPNENLSNTSNEISNKYAVQTDFLEINLTDSNGPQKVYNWCNKNNYNLTILINNAGLAGATVFEKSSLEYNDSRILLNIRALVLLTRLFIPNLKKSTNSYILNIGSLSAYYSIPFKSVYAASKAFVLSFSKSLKDELQKTTISVSVVCPNGVETNKESLQRLKSHGKMGRLTKISPQELAKYSISKMFQKKSVIIPKRINRFLLFVKKILPENLLQKLIHREFKKEISQV